MPGLSAYYNSSGPLVSDAAFYVVRNADPVVLAAADEEETLMMGPDGPEAVPVDRIMLWHGVAAGTSAR